MHQLSTVGTIRPRRANADFSDAGSKINKQGRLFEQCLLLFDSKKGELGFQFAVAYRCLEGRASMLYEEWRRRYRRGNEVSGQAVAA